MAETEQLISEIVDYCRRAGVAESTFGRFAVNDGKFVNRLREGGRVTTTTAERVRTFIVANPPAHGAAQAPAQPQIVSPAAGVAGMSARPAASNGANDARTERNFRFYDNRQKYLLFVNTCSEKSQIARRVGMELANIHPRPPAVRVFDAGIGDGTVLTSTMRAMHTRYPNMPFHIVGKEISLEDVRLTLEKMPDRFFEHPAMVLVITNLNYTDAPWLIPQSMTAASSLVWHEVPLTGTTSHEFETQISGLGSFLAENWRVSMNSATGKLAFDRPAVLVLYREDHRFLLEPVIPRRGGSAGEYDLVVASQPYRARMPIEFKAGRVIAPLARSLREGGRLLGIHSHGSDPGLEIVQGIWPGENPFVHDRHQMLKAVKESLGPAGRHLNFNAYSDARSLFRYDMHALPSELHAAIGTSTLLAAWNAAVYVGQIEDARLESVLGDRRYLDVTASVLHRHNGLWFQDESFVISRHRS